MIIESLGVYLPERLVATADILQECRCVPAGPFQRLTGIERRPVVGPQEYSIDLARLAVDRCLRLSRRARETIDLVICCNISRCDGPHQRMSIEPTTASRLCAEFGFSSAEAFDVSNACAGTFTGLLLAQSAFAAGAARRALIVSGEHITHLVATARREIESLSDPRMACLTLGDSGVAMLVEADGPPGVGFQAIDLFTLGRYSGLCTGSLTDRPHGGAIMLTHSRRLTEAALEHCVPHAPATLAAHDWDPARVDTFITHQTAKLALDKARAGLNRNLRRTWLRDDNFVSNVRDRGNLATNSHFVALHDRARQGRLQNGQRVVFSIAASGLTGGTALYSLDDLPDRLRQKPNGYAQAPEPPRGDRVWRPKSSIRIAAVAVADGDPPSLGVVEMAAAAGRQCLARADCAARDVDVLIFCGVYRERLLSEPAVAALVAGELGVERTDAARRYSTFAFDVSHGAVGFLKACHCAAQLIDAGPARRALVVASELQGDPAVSLNGARIVASTASAALVERGDGSRGFDSFCFRLFDEHRGLRASYCQRTNGSTHLLVEEDAQFAEIGDQCAAAAVEQFSEASLGQVNWGLLLGAGGPKLKAMLGRLGVPPDRIITPPSLGGDLFTSSFVYAWQALEQSPLRRPGERVLALQVGSGMRVGCAAYVL